MTHNDGDFVKVQRYLLCHFIHFKYRKAHTLQTIRHKDLAYLHNANDKKKVFRTFPFVIPAHLRKETQLKTLVHVTTSCSLEN